MNHRRLSPLLLGVLAALALATVPVMPVVPATPASAAVDTRTRTQTGTPSTDPSTTAPLPTPTHDAVRVEGHTTDHTTDHTTGHGSGLGVGDIVYGSGDLIDGAPRHGSSTAAADRPASLFDRPMTLAEALTQIDAATIGLRNNLVRADEIARLRGVADDPSAYVDRDGRLFYADQFSHDGHDEQNSHDSHDSHDDHAVHHVYDTHVHDTHVHDTNDTAHHHDALTLRSPAAAVGSPSTSTSSSITTTTTTTTTATTGSLSTSTPITAALTTAEIASGAPAPLADTFLLESRPGSQRVIYLDFDGAVVQNTGWNNMFSAPTITATGVDFDSTPGEFTSFELATIQQIWHTVAEDYAAFDVNVTTRFPGLNAIDRTSALDQAYGSWVVITPIPAAITCGCAGIAYVDVFDWVGSGTSTHMYYQPAWAFGMGPDNGLIISHEVGHNFGLSHDGTSSLGYYGGHTHWGPIMGNPFSRAVTQWSRGQYPDAFNLAGGTFEDDIAVIAANGAPLTADDHGNDAASATALSAGFAVSGIINSSTDVDVFTINWPGGNFTANASPSAVDPNLDIQLQLKNSVGTLVISVDPASSQRSELEATGVGATISQSLAAGTYTLWIDGVGIGDPGTSYANGYSDYGSIGRYQLTATPRTLTAHRFGYGTGTITSSTGGINCGATCSGTYAGDTLVTLTAVEAPGSNFTGWTGSCWWFYIDTCTVSVDRARAATATFDLLDAATLTVTKAGAGSGTVTSSTGGIDCGSVCSSQFAIGATVTLTASPAVGSVFGGWSGGSCTGTGTCEVTLDGSTTVTATFSTAFRMLTISKAGDGTGTVVSSPAAINCGNTCSANLPLNSTYTLTATPSAANILFTGWSGGGCTSTGTCVVTMDAAKTVTATFTRIYHALTVTKTGTGTGRVFSTLGGVDCGTTCSGSVIQGTSVTFVAQPALGMRFDGWTGGGCSGTLDCTVTVNAPVSVTAAFTQIGDTFREFRTPLRLIDTRPNNPGLLDPAAGADLPFAPNTTRRYLVTSVLGVPVGATLHLNVVAVGPLANGNLNIYPCASLSTTPPTASFMNFRTGVNVANAGFVSVGTGGGICIRATAQTHVVVDGAGWFPSGSTFVPLAAPVRLLDTRTAQGTAEPVNQTTPFAALEVRRYLPLGTGGLPGTGVAALAINVVAASPTGTGALQVYPCASLASTPPAGRTVSFSSGVNIATGGIVVPDTSGGICVRATAGTHVVIDTPGYFGSAGGWLTFGAAALPVRLIDTQPGISGALETALGTDISARLVANTVYRFVVAGNAGYPAAGSLGAVALTITAVSPTANGWMKAWACDAVTDPPPTTTTFNYRTNITIGNLAIVHASSTGGICVQSLAATHVAIDSTGWFAR